MSELTKRARDELTEYETRNPHRRLLTRGLVIILRGAISLAEAKGEDNLLLQAYRYADRVLDRLSIAPELRSVLSNTISAVESGYITLQHADVSSPDIHASRKRQEIQESIVKTQREIDIWFSVTIKVVEVKSRYSAPS